jgi:arylsulfatase A-like enzyme
MWARGHVSSFGPGPWRRVAIVVLLLGCPAPTEAPSETRPNVLLYVVDTLRADSLGSYGNPKVATPAADRFAREGRLFENAFASSSWTRPSMASLLTGLHPTRHGTERRNASLPPGVRTLAEILSQSGYATAFLTANPNVGSFFGFGRGFDRLVEMYERRQAGRVLPRELIVPSDAITSEAIEWLASAPRPFFLAILTVDPHAPYEPPERFDRYGAADAGPVVGSFPFITREGLSEEDRARIRSLYQGEVSFNDDSFGRLVEPLRMQGRLDSTIAVFTSDHGEEFWEHDGRRGHGNSLSDAVIHVPLVLRYPASPRVGRGVRVARPVQLVDVLPTILELAGIAAPEGLDGRSLLAPVEDAERPVFASLRRMEHHVRAVRAHPWKLVWDLRRGRFDFYDLREEPKEEHPVTAPEGAALAAFERLQLELARSAREARSGAKATPDVPDELRDALRALGYVDGNE